MSPRTRKALIPYRLTIVDRPGDAAGSSGREGTAGAWSGRIRNEANLPQISPQVLGWTLFDPLMRPGVGCRIGATERGGPTATRHRGLPTANLPRIIYEPNKERHPAVLSDDRLYLPAPHRPARSRPPQSREVTQSSLFSGMARAIDAESLESRHGSPPDADPPIARAWSRRPPDREVAPGIDRRTRPRRGGCRRGPGR